MTRIHDERWRERLDGRATERRTACAPLPLPEVGGLRSRSSVRRVGVNSDHREQWQVETVDLAEYAMQRRFIWELATNQRTRRGVVGDAQTVQPVRPMRVELAVDANLIPAH
jgi:hypothetical protein